MNPSPILISRTEVGELLDWPAVYEATRSGLIVSGTPSAASSISAQVTYAKGSLHLKAAALDVQEIISVKSNLRPNHGGVSGVLLAYDLESERLAGIIDAGLMTAWRTGAIAAVAAERLVAARPVTVAVLGVGPVGQRSIEALLEVLDVVEVRFWSHHGTRSNEAAEHLRERVPARACRHVDEAISGADVIVTATPASEPIVTETLPTGVVILAMGADTVGKRELASQVIARSVVVADVPADALKVGESAYLPNERKESVTALAHWLTTLDPPPHDYPYLVFDSVGSSHVDAAVTSVIMKRALARGVGTRIEW